MGKWLRSIISDLLAQLLLLGGGVAIVVVGWLEDLAVYQILLLALGVFAVVFFAINQYRIFRESRKKSIANMSDKEIEDTIHKWLDKPGALLTRELKSDSYFQFVIMDQQRQIPIYVRRPKLEPLLLEIGVIMNVSNNIQIRLQALEEIERENILHDLRIEMVRLGISFEGIKYPLEKIRLIELVSIDDNLRGFVNRCVKVRQRQVPLPY